MNRRRTKSIGAFAAKTHFSALLERAEKGEIVEITRRGKPVAELRPVVHRSEEEVQRILAEFRKLRKGRSLGGMTIRQLIDDGRRY